VLHLESRRARTGIVEALPRRISAFILREFGDRFLVTNLGFFWSSHRERKTSLRGSWRICWTSLGVTSMVQVSWTKDWRCWKVHSVFPSSVTHLIHSTDHGSTVFIQNFQEFFLGFMDCFADLTLSLGISDTTGCSADPTSLLPLEWSALLDLCRIWIWVGHSAASFSSISDPLSPFFASMSQLIVGLIFSRFKTEYLLNDVIGGHVGDQVSTVLLENLAWLLPLLGLQWQVHRHLCIQSLHP